MVDDLLFDVTVTFSLVTGTAAGLLALLTWEILRHTTLGRAVFVLSAGLVLFAFYHAILLVFHAEPLVADVFRSAMFTCIAAFIGLLIHLQHSLDGDPSGGAG